MGKIDPVAQPQDLFFTLGEAPAHEIAQLIVQLTIGNVFKQILFGADHIHQRQRTTILARFDVFREGNVGAAFLLRAKIHQYFVLHTAGCVGRKSGSFCLIVGGNALNQTDGTDGNQIILVRSLGVVLLKGLSLEEFF